MSINDHNTTSETLADPSGKPPADLASALALIAELMKALKGKNIEIAKLQQRIDQLLRNRFGRRAEKLDYTTLLPMFRELFEADAPAENPESDVEIAATAKPKSKRGRKKLPEHLPVKEVIHDVSEQDRVCPDCSQAMTSIGDDVTELLDHVPASYFRVRHVRRKYACRECQGNVISAPAPPKPIEKGMAGAGLLAHIITSKYCDHLPLYRLEGIIKRHGVDLGRSTMCDWMFDSANLLAPIVERMRAEIMRSKVVFTDDTTIPYQDTDSTKTKTGRLWTHIGDPEHRFVYFDFTTDHSRDGPERMFRGYEGYIQADALSQYDRIFSEKIIEVACWAHARRKFFEQKDKFPDIAYRMLAMIRELYAVEAEASEFELAQLIASRLEDPAAVLDMDRPYRHELRQKRSRPILDRIEEYLKSVCGMAPPSMGISGAIQYTLKNWDALRRYLEQGYLEIDNNLSERTIKVVVLGRKNWLFAGSETGGLTAATLFSLTATCKLLKIDPYAYLRDAITAMSGGGRGDIGDLLPGRLGTSSAVLAGPN